MPRELQADGSGIPALWKRFSIVFSLASMLWFLLSIELTLAWNSIAGVYSLNSTGQLIPFIIGFLGFLRALHLIFLDFMDAVGPMLLSMLGTMILIYIEDKNFI